MSRVTRLSRQLDRKRKAVFASHGLETWAFDVLSSLRRAGDPYQMSPSALTIELLVTSGTMTNRIDRLASAGWVSRQRDPGDRRGVLVQLTAEGRRKVDDALSDFLELEAQMLRELDDTECASLADSLRHLVASVESVDTFTGEGGADEQSQTSSTGGPHVGDPSADPGARTVSRSARLKDSA